MNDTLQYIDDYFTGQLRGGDRATFEKRCEDDPEFAQEVSLYISMRGAMRKSFHDVKKKDFESFHREHGVKDADKVAIPLYAFISAIAATVLIIAAVLYFNQSDPEQLATAYIDDNLETISVTMGAEQDSLAMGVNAYNDKDYGKARSIFKDLIKHPSVEFNCVKYLGLVSLKTDSYDSALYYFNRLSGFTNMYANPGAFYKALTLMKRSDGNDVKDATVILEQVVKNKMSGHKEAEHWLEELD